jgi:superfamily II DNA helicase RecQ
MRFFTIPVVDADEAVQELERFLAEHRILAIDRRFVPDGRNSAWCLCIEYLEAAEQPPTTKRGKVDYREVLDEQDFLRYSRLRELRKRLAEREGLPVYALFTNEQMAAMVQQRVASRAQLLEIPGIGEGRVEKYGQAFLDLLQQVWAEPPKPEDTGQ